MFRWSRWKQEWSCLCALSCFNIHTDADKMSSVVSTTVCPWWKHFYLCTRFMYYKTRTYTDLASCQCPLWNIVSNVNVVVLVRKGWVMIKDSHAEIEYETWPIRLSFLSYNEWTQQELWHVFLSAYFNRICTLVYY